MIKLTFMYISKFFVHKLLVEEFFSEDGDANSFPPCLPTHKEGHSEGVGIVFGNLHGYYTK